MNLYRSTDALLSSGDEKRTRREHGGFGNAVLPQWYPPLRSTSPENCKG